MNLYKALPAVLTAVSMMFTAAVSAVFGEESVSEYRQDFEGFETGTFAAGTDNWQQWIQNTSSNVALAVKKEDGKNNQYLELSKQSSGETTLYRDFKDLVSDFSEYDISFSLKANYKNSSIRMEFGTTYEMWYDKDSGKYTFGTWNGTSNAVIDGVLVDFSDWNTFKFTMDTTGSEKKVSVYINGSLIAENLSMKSGISATRFTFRMSNGCTGAIDIDDFLVQETPLAPFECNFDGLVSNDITSLKAENVSFEAVNAESISFDAVSGKFGKSGGDASLFISSEAVNTGGYISVTGDDWTVKQGEIFEYLMNFAAADNDAWPVVLSGDGNVFLEIYHDKLKVFGETVYTKNILQAEKWYNIRLIGNYDAEYGSLGIYIDDEAVCTDADAQMSAGLTQICLNAPVSESGVYFDDVAYYRYNQSYTVKTAEVKANDSIVSAYRSGLDFYCDEDTTAEDFLSVLSGEEIKSFTIRGTDGLETDGKEAAAGNYIEIKKNDGTYLYGRIRTSQIIYENAGTVSGVKAENGSDITSESSLGAKETDDYAIIISGEGTETVAFNLADKISAPLIYEASLLVSGEVSGEMQLSALKDGTETKCGAVWFENGEILVKNSDGGFETAGTYRDNQWMRLSVAVYPEKDSADIFIDGRAVSIGSKVFDTVPQGFSGAGFSLSSLSAGNGDFAALDDIKVSLGINDIDKVSVYGIMDDVAVDDKNSVIYYPEGVSLADCIRIGYNVRVAEWNEEYFIVNSGHVYKYYKLIEGSTAQPVITVSESGGRIIAEAQPAVSGAVMIVAAFDSDGRMISVFCKENSVQTDIPSEAVYVKAMYVNSLSCITPLCEHKLYEINKNDR